MSCYRPLHGIDKGWTEEGKRDIVILPHDAVTYQYEGKGYRFMDIPCGHCIGCRQDQSREWSNRLIMESLYHDAAHFVTLTYCDEYVPLTTYVDQSTGELRKGYTLRKRDFQLFMKRLRKSFSESKIRFYAAGEYGDQTQRPHFHAIIFGLPESKMHFIPCGKSETGNPYFRCPEIEDNWKATEPERPLGCNAQAAKQGLSPDLLGFVSVEPANHYTMKYVCAYVTKKIGAHPNQVFESKGQVPPFSLSSRKPGIGLQYLEDHPEIMEKDKIVIATPTGKVECGLPRYFKKKFSEIDPGLIDELSEKHLKAAADRLSAELSRTDLYYDDYLKIKENNHLSRLRTRNKI